MSCLTRDDSGVTIKVTPVMFLSGEVFFNVGKGGIYIYGRPGGTQDVNI